MSCGGGERGTRVRDVDAGTPVERRQVGEHLVLLRQVVAVQVVPFVRDVAVVAADRARQRDVARIQLTGIARKRGAENASFSPRRVRRSCSTRGEISFQEIDGPLPS